MPSRCFNLKLALIFVFLPSPFWERGRGEGLSTRKKNIFLSFFALIPHPTLSQRERAYNKKAATWAASRCSFCCRSLNDYYSLVFIKISQHHFNDLALFRRHEFADVVRLNRQFTM